MPTYAITGASGQLGRLAVYELLARGVPASDVVAVVRTPSRAADLAGRGVQVREADYARPHALGSDHRRPRPNDDGRGGRPSAQLWT